jgi:predicted metal-dependent phosphoesterase TrpH
MKKVSGYYIETHMHTSESSTCGSISAADGVTMHKEAGFDAVIITDHFNKGALGRMGADTDEGIRNWLAGYEKARLAGQEAGIDVFLGAEFAFSGGKNEYLLYGISTENLPELYELFESGIKDLYEHTRRKDILIIQAHPFRTGNCPAPDEFIDGAEIYNGNPRHINYNPQAKDFCKKHNLIMTAGGDFHETEDLSYAMRSDKAIRSMPDFTGALKNGAMDICKYTEEAFKPVD